MLRHETDSDTHLGCRIRGAGTEAGRVADEVGEGSSLPDLGTLGGVLICSFLLRFHEAISDLQILETKSSRNP